MLRATLAPTSVCEHVNVWLTCGMGGARYLSMRMSTLAPAAADERPSSVQHLRCSAAPVGSTDSTSHCCPPRRSAARAPQQKHWPPRRRAQLVDHLTGCTADWNYRNQRSPSKKSSVGPQWDCRGRRRRRQREATSLRVIHGYRRPTRPFSLFAKAHLNPSKALLIWREELKNDLFVA